MKLIILEDQVPDRDKILAFLEKYTQHTGYELTALPCGASEELPQDLSCVDAALLDIMIEGQAAGVDVARSLRLRNWKGPIVFITASPDFYAEGFEVDAAHYLLKPFTYKAFTEAMDRLVRQTGRPKRTVTLPLRRKEIQVSEDEIIYVEVYGKETLLHTLQEDVLRLLMPLKEVETLLEGGSFLRCFRSYLVNMEHIVQIDHEAFVLSNNARVPISRRNKAEIKEKYLEYRFEKLRRKRE